MKMGDKNKGFKIKQNIAKKKHTDKYSSHTCMTQHLQKNKFVGKKKKHTYAILECVQVKTQKIFHQKDSNFIILLQKCDKSIFKR